MYKVAICGTGSSAEIFLKDINDLHQVIGFFETVPRSKSFKNLPVKPLYEIPKDVSKIYVASMFYPDIIDQLLAQGIDINKIEVAVGHRDDPRFGSLKIKGTDVLPKLGEYRAFKEKIAKVTCVVDSYKPISIRDRLKHLVHALENAHPQGEIVEFGVYRGESLLYLAENTKRPVWGFDSFCGFAESSFWSKITDDGRKSVPLPKMLNQYKYLVPGFFEHTLTPWLNKAKVKEISFIHYDAADYHAAKYVFKTLKPYLTPGCVLVCDEFIPSPTELKANEYQAVVDVFGDEYEIISKSGQAVAMIIG